MYYCVGVTVVVGGVVFRVMVHVVVVVIASKFPPHGMWFHGHKLPTQKVTPYTITE